MPKPYGCRSSALLKGHVSEILRGKGSPTVATLTKLAKAPGIEVRELFTFPERSRRDRVIELLETAKPETVRRVLRLVAVDAEGSVAPAVADDHPACRPVVVQAIPCA